jgi:hypothetical protein
MLDLIKQKEAIPEKRLRFDSTTKQYVEYQNRELFIKGPIPLPWLSAAAALPGKPLNVALALWWLAGMSKAKEIHVNTAALKHFVLSNDAYLDGLNRLECAGLITLARRAGSRALVSLVVSKAASAP